MSQFPEIKALFESNKAWAEKVHEVEPELFPAQAKGQVSHRSFSYRPLVASASSVCTIRLGGGYLVMKLTRS
jgi:hypothetical protein